MPAALALVPLAWRIALLHSRNATKHAAMLLMKFAKEILAQSDQMREAQDDPKGFLWNSARARLMTKTPTQN